MQNMAPAAPLGRQSAKKVTHGYRFAAQSHVYFAKSLDNTRCRVHSRVYGPIRLYGSGQPIFGVIAKHASRGALSLADPLLSLHCTAQDHENELAEVVIVCEPEQSSLMMGGLHPRGSLYERPVSVRVYE